MSYKAAVISSCRSEHESLHELFHVKLGNKREIRRNTWNQLLHLRRIGKLFANLQSEALCLHGCLVLLRRVPMHRYLMAPGLLFLVFHLITCLVCSVYGQIRVPLASTEFRYGRYIGGPISWPPSGLFYNTYALCKYYYSLTYISINSSCPFWQRCLS